MTHDPMCPPQAIRSANPCHYCDLIRRVREDEREKTYTGSHETHQAAWHDGYRKGVEDERKRSVLLIADAYRKGVEDAAQVVYDMAVRPRQMTVTPLSDAVAAIRGLVKEKS